MLKIFCFVLIFIAVAQGRVLQNNLITLTPENLNQNVENENIFVIFIYDFENYKKFIERLGEITEKLATAANEESKELNFGIFDCKENPSMCRNVEISQKIEYKFYGENNKWPTVSSYLTQIIQEVLQEDDLINLLNKPGRLLVLYKIDPCPYSQQVLKIWPRVKRDFLNNENIKIFTIDCKRRRPICRRFGVRGYPDIKFIYNSENSLQTIFPYLGDRSYEDIRNFADEYIKATIATAQGRVFQNDLITLTPENFDKITENQNIFVTFIYDFEVHQKFIELLDEIKKTAAESDDLDSRMLKFGIFDCKKNIKQCKKIRLGHGVEVRFYGKTNKWPALSEFLDQIVDEVLQEDEFIEALEKPGRYLVLFKIASCIYCKETLKYWKEVKDYFTNNEYIKTYTLDCTRRRSICKRFEITKYPKIRFIYNSKHNKQSIFSFEEFDLERTTGGILKFAIEHMHSTMK